MLNRIIAISWLLAFTCASGTAADWGDLTITFRYDGKAPDTKTIKPDKDLNVCGQQKIVEDRLVVNPSNGGIANIFLWLSVEKGTKVEVHESYSAASKDLVELVLDNNKCVFQPHVLAIRTGQALIVKNSDQCGHNTNFTMTANPSQNFTIPAKTDAKVKFDKEERLPSPVQCNIHTWMKSWLLVKETPYFAVSDADGRVEIKNLPAGKWSFQAWHEASGYVREVTIAGKSVKWNRGRIENQVIKAGKNDLGDVKVETKLFANQ